MYLLSCPFCGSNHPAIAHTLAKQKTFTVVCPSCGARSLDVQATVGNLTSAEYMKLTRAQITKAEKAAEMQAALAWNRRAPLIHEEKSARPE